jgi:hypothetical protein
MTFEHVRAGKGRSWSHLAMVVSSVGGSAAKFRALEFHHCIHPGALSSDFQSSDELRNLLRGEFFTTGFCGLNN